MRSNDNLVAIYCRLSKEDLDKAQEDSESESIKNQKSMLTAYAHEKNWIVYDYYIDEDYSGSDRYRPEFNRLITDSVAGCFGIVLCKKQSRFARDIEYVERYIHGLFAEKRIRFVAVLDNIDTGLPSRTYSKTSRINSLVDEWYLEDLSDNTSSALTVKRKNGDFIGSWAPYGYKKDPLNKNRLIIDDEAADVVKRIFDLYCSGYGITAIAKILNREGIPNPTLYKQQNGIKIHTQAKTKKFFLWSASTISSILKNQTYIGDLIQGKFRKVSYKSKKLIRLPKEQWIIVENCHDPIIESRVWQKAQYILNSKSRINVKDNKRHIFAGKVFCGECGEILLSSGGQSGRRKVNYLVCSTRRHFTKGCIGVRIEQSKLQSIVMERFKNLIIRYFDEDYILNNINTICDKIPENKLTEQANRVKQQINMKSDRIEAAYLDKLNGLISKDEFIKVRNHLRDEQSKLKIRLNALEEEMRIQNNNYAENQTILEQKISLYKNPVCLSREIADLFVDSVYVYHTEKDMSQKIKINWSI